MVSPKDYDIVSCHLDELEGNVVEKLRSCATRELSIEASFVFAPHFRYRDFASETELRYCLIGFVLVLECADSFTRRSTSHLRITGTTPLKPRGMRFVYSPLRNFTRRLFVCNQRLNAW